MVSVAQVYDGSVSLSSDTGSVVGPLQGLIGGRGGSVQVEKLSGSGGLGSYQIQISDTGTKYVNQGSAIVAEGITQLTNITAQFVQVIPVTLPDAGTKVQVTLVVADDPN